MAKRDDYEARLDKAGLSLLDTEQDENERRDEAPDVQIGAATFDVPDLPYDAADLGVDLDDQYRALYYSKYGAEVRGDGDDNGPKGVRDSSWSRLPVKRGRKGEDLDFDADKIDPTKRHTYDVVRVQRKQLDNVGGQMIEDCHGFLIGQQIKPWKIARRTHCRNCGSELPEPDVSKYPCEFGSDEQGCRCNGCTRRQLNITRHARGRGRPLTYCGEPCRRLWNNATDRYDRAVKRAHRNGTEPPAPPEDQGLKMVRHTGPGSSIEGHGHRYVSARRGVCGG